MAPIIVLGTFGILSQASGGRAPLSYLVALVAMFLTALSYAHMCRAYPVSGSSYTYVSKAIDPRLGFLTGWSILLDYLFLPMAIWLIGAAYLHSVIRTVPQSVWLPGFIVISSAINIIGLKLAAKLNVTLLVLQCLVMIAFGALCVHYVLGDPTKPLFTLTPFGSNGASLPLVMTGAGIACYSYLGFDAVSTLTEETKDPQRTVPKAILLVTLIGGGIFVAMSYIVQVAHPSTSFVDADSAANEIAKNIGGDVFVMLFLIGMVVGQFASGIAAQASASRLLFALGRDSVFPKRIFAYLSPRFQTPVFTILLTAAFALLALKMDVTTSTSFINFGAFLTFTLVNLSVIFHYRLRLGTRGMKSTVMHALLPVLGIASTIALMLSLDRNAVMLGLSWLAIGVVYLGYLTRFFRVPPPELHMSNGVH
ncbi:Putrescine importer PuuP [Paraburkholderia caffeinitolerans]|uniref:Putrescine importer PuuP n=3 Tax=Burkholderiaceae TaxID=119060 RepID=A0A6J5FNH6_9BURK|nr:amino acid permease [Paraburkholderia caffeinilytica]CAB3782074.1 Putrescine importer PuuP [Paraburkholderia caffeinitolerans]